MPAAGFSQSKMKEREEKREGKGDGEGGEKGGGVEGSVEGRERDREKQSSSCDIFHYLALEVTLLHFHTVLLVAVISTVL